jgi:hypothetical protein
MKYVICCAALLSALTPNLAGAEETGAEDTGVEASTFAPGEAPDWRITFRGGMHFIEDQSFDAVSDESLRGAAEIGAAWAIDEHWWIGGSFYGGGNNDQIYEDFETHFQTTRFRAHALYRMWLMPGLAGFGRLGGSYGFHSLRLRDGLSREIEASEWTPGVHGGIGIEYMPVSHAYISKIKNDFGFGVSAELTYARYLPVHLEAAGVELGRLDPSGPGWVAGVVFQW